MFPNGGIIIQNICWLFKESHVYTHASKINGNMHSHRVKKESYKSKKTAQDSTVSEKNGNVLLYEKCITNYGSFVLM